MAAARDSFVDLENTRLQLEENIAKLRKSLQYWQTWEAEYEGLKEEILRLGEDHSENELTSIANEFDGELLNEKEVNSLFRTPDGKQRNGKQIVGLLSRRIDYVQENVRSVTKQIQNAEQMLEASETISQSNFRDDAGLPLTEIREELDEEGNVISSSATRAGNTAPQILEALHKVGANDVLDTSEALPLKSNLPTTSVKEISLDEEISKTANASAKSEIRQSEEEVDEPSDQAAQTSSESDKVRHLGRKKSVSFAEGTKTEDSTISRKRQPHPLFAKPRGARSLSKVETIAEVQAKTPEGQLNSLLQAEQDVLASGDGASSDSEIISPVIPEKEAPEDAALRRQMLQYNMNELSAVVAEIDLDEQGSTPPYSSDEDDAYDDSSTEGEEDEYGRTNVVFSDDYIKEMQALEKRLNASVIQNVGPALKSEDSSSEVHENPSNPGKPTASTSPATPPTKEVRFASKLNIQEAPNVNSSSNQSVETADEAAAADSIRKDDSQKKVSRFKSARNNGVAPTPNSDKSTGPTASTTSTGPVADKIIERPVGTTASTSIPRFPPALASSRASRPTPSGPPGRPHASSIIERPYTPTANPDTPPAEPDEFDPAMLQQQAVIAYHQQRNRLIHKQGGFLRQEDEAEVPVDENGEEQGRKVSRFKAARLGKRG